MSKRVQIYFGEHDQEAYDDLMKVVKATRLSISEIAFASFVWGFYELARDDGFNMPMFKKESNAKRRKSKKPAK